MLSVLPDRIADMNDKLWKLLEELQKFNVFADEVQFMLLDNINTMFSTLHNHYNDKLNYCKVHQCRFK